MSKILVVDDYSITRKILSHQLHNNGHEAILASNGHEALRCLSENQVDLAILDIAMPEMDGITLLMRLRADERYKNLPVIMLTASGQDNDRQIAETEGISGFLTKPVSSIELAEAVNRCLSGHLAGAEDHLE
jgi:two-component system, chemotaxis family, chemotaxis protein CheY